MKTTIDMLYSKKQDKIEGRFGDTLRFLEHDQIVFEYRELLVNSAQ